MMYSSLTEWYANDSNAKMVDLIRVLKKAEMHNFVQRLKFVCESTKGNNETEGYAFKTLKTYWCYLQSVTNMPHCRVEIQQ